MATLFDSQFKIVRTKRKVKNPCVDHACVLSLLSSAVRDKDRESQLYPAKIKECRRVRGIILDAVERIIGGQK